MLRGNFNDVGGRQVHQDDLRILQEQWLKSVQLQYAGQGAFIIQGCGVSGTAGNYTIASGIVYINGLIMEFSSVSGVASFPRYIVQAADVQQDSFPLEQGGSAYKRTLVKAELSASAPGSGEFITMSASGGRSYNDILSAQFVRIAGNQTVNGQKTFTSPVISNGLNLNSEISNLNSSLGTKADKVTSITANEGLTGGGNLSANRSIGISNGGVSNAKLAEGSVSEGKLASNAVSTSKIQDASISTSKIVDGSVTNAKLANDAVGTTKIVNGSVTSEKLADGSISIDKLANSTITETVAMAGGSLRFVQWGKVVVVSGSFKPGTANNTGSGSFNIPASIGAPAYQTHFSTVGEGYFNSYPGISGEYAQYKLWGWINTNKTINWQTSYQNAYYYLNAVYIAV